jgi:GNAT superfamily N-acetyltransferase
LCPSLPRVAFEANRPHRRPGAAWDGTDTFSRVVVTETIDNFTVHFAGEADVDGVCALLGRDSAKPFAREDLAEFLTAPPAVSLVAVLLGSVQFQPRRPNKRGLDGAKLALVESLRVRLPDGDGRIQNASIPAVQVAAEARGQGIGRLLVSYFLRFCESVYGAVSFTTEVSAGNDCLVSRYRGQHFRMAGNGLNRFLDRQGRWLERHLLLEDATVSAITPPQFSPFVMLEADDDSTDQFILANYEHFAVLHSLEARYYQELRRAHDLLLDKDCRDALIRELCPKHGKRGTIVYETCELSSLDIVTRRAHKFTLEPPTSTTTRVARHIHDPQCIGCPTSGVAQCAMRETAPHARGGSQARQL